MNQEEDSLRKFKKAVFTMRAGQPLPFRAGESGEGGWVLSAWEEALILSVVIISASQALLMKSPSLFWEQVWSDRKMKKPHFMQVKRLAHDLPAERKWSSAGSHPQPLCLQAPRALPVLFCRLYPSHRSQMQRHRGHLARVHSWLVAGACGVSIREAG